MGKKFPRKTFPMHAALTIYRGCIEVIMRTYGSVFIWVVAKLWSLFGPLL